MFGFLRFFVVVALLEGTALAVFAPPKVGFADLLLPSEVSSAVFASALRDVGLLSVEEIPNFAQLRKRVLLAASECALNVEAKNGFEYVFPDGTSRYTLASKTVHGRQQKIEGADVVASFPCEKFNRLQSEFRTVVNEVGKLFVKRLDEFQGNSFGTNLLLDSESKTYFDSFQEIISTGEQLEHFHTYEKVQNSVESSSSKPFTLDLHVDQGLFIAIVPAIFVNNENFGKEKEFSQKSGFYIQLSSGETVEIDFGNGDKIVFMLGDSIPKYLNNKLKVPLRSVPHSMKMPKSLSLSDKVIRSWYGRMFLLPKSTFLKSLDTTFGEVQSSYQNRKLLSEISSTICSDNLVLETRLLATVCSSETEILCWSSCVAELTCSNSSETTQCMKEVSTDVFEVCDGSEVNPNCVPTCSLQQTENNGETEAEAAELFCNGFKVSMFMDGFTTVSENTQCLVFLFKNFVLDTKTKYVGAALLTIVICLFLEFVVSLRRKVEKAKVKTETNLKIKKAVQVVLYSVQVAFGYIAMLLAMTYSVVIFLLVIFGLTLGHVLFNFKTEKLSKSSENCCETKEQTEAKQISI